MQNVATAALCAQIASLTPDHPVGRVSAVEGQTLDITGLSAKARLGDTLELLRPGTTPLLGEVLRMTAGHVTMLPYEAPEGVTLGAPVRLGPAGAIAPDDSWIGRIVDPFGKPLDGKPLLRGARARRLFAQPPRPAQRRPLGARVDTGMAVFNTLLPIVRGQRLGLFAGSGVGKTSLLGHLGRHMEADVIVFALIGERGRELREFVDTVLGPEGMKRSVIVAATSDVAPLVRRRCAWTAMSIAEHFRDQGRHVLFLADSVTRFAEAHREVSTALGELPALRGFPASTAHTIMSLCERAGPGEEGAGDITALFSVLVAGSDMEEPVADILRGVLDGHIVLDRTIAERGRYPAIDLLRSVSRSLPGAARESENEMISRARKLLGAYDRSETMVKAGLYAEGSDPDLDHALKVWPELDAFLAEQEAGSIENSFNKLALILRRAGQAGGRTRPSPGGAARPEKEPSAPARAKVGAKPPLPKRATGSAPGHASLALQGHTVQGNGGLAALSADPTA
jgi:flagellum-specific ATP synthase